jgi:hypothetical protein
MAIFSAVQSGGNIYQPVLPRTVEGEGEDENFTIND